MLYFNNILTLFFKNELIKYDLANKKVYIRYLYINYYCTRFILEIVMEVKYFEQENITRFRTCTGCCIINW